MKRATRKFLSAFLALSMVLAILPVLAPQTAYAAGASGLKTAIESYTGGAGASGGRLTATVNGNTVTVTGSITNVSETLSLNIDEGVTVDWKASLESAENFSPRIPEAPTEFRPLIMLEGAGSLTVSGNGKIAAHSAVAIRASSDATVAITVEGSGCVQAKVDGAPAIYGGFVDITGGEVSATTGGAVYNSRDGGFVTVSGGRVFSYASKILSTDSADQDSVIYTANASGFTGATGTGMVIGWNKAAETINYTAGTSTDIVKSPDEATAVWGKSGDADGIFYTNGSNTGFIPLAVTVTGAADPAPALSAGTAARTGETQASIGFTTSEAGTAYYKAVEKGAAAPGFDASGWTPLGAVSGTVTGKSVTLTAGAKDIYVVVEDISGNASDALIIAVGAIYPKDPVPTMEVYVWGNKDFRGDDIVDGATDISISEIITGPDAAIASAKDPSAALGGAVRLSGVAVGTTSIVVRVDGMSITVPISVVAPPDDLKPVLSAGSVNRTSDTAATIGFTTSKAGYVYYLVQDAGADAPALPEDMVSFENGGRVEAGPVSLSVVLTPGARDVYVLVIEETYMLPGNLLRIEVPAYGAPDAPAAPTLESKTHNSVTLTANPAYEFSIGGSHWQTDNEFTELAANTLYTFYQRVAATADTPASAASPGLSERTDAAPVKSVTVGAQVGELSAGTSGYAIFEVATANIASNSAIALNNTNSVSGITLGTPTTTGSSTSVVISIDDTTPNGNHPLTLTIDGVTSDSFNLVVGSAPPVVYAIALDVTDTYTFPSALEGYGAQAEKPVAVSNTGNQATGPLTISLSGSGADSFILSKTSMTDIATNGGDSFTVTPKDGLATGTHTATVMVSGGNGISESFAVSFTVGARSIPVSGITVSGGSGIIVKNGTLQLSVSVLPTDAANKAVTWSIVSGNSYASVSPSGLVTAIANGTVKVRATAQDGSGVYGEKTINISGQSTGGNGGGGYTQPAESTGTVYNHVSQPSATVWLSGSGFSAGDLLVTETLTKGGDYNALIQLAEKGDILRVYDISLKSGKRQDGGAMHLTFALGAGYAGQSFTLVHKKADGTFEYLYATANANGQVKFGPLYELSPFMLVKGTLLYLPTDQILNVPKTGESSGTLPFALLALAALCGMGAVLYRKKQTRA